MIVIDRPRTLPGKDHIVRRLKVREQLQAVHPLRLYSLSKPRCLPKCDYGVGPLDCIQILTWLEEGPLLRPSAKRFPDDPVQVGTENRGLCPLQNQIAKFL